MSVTLHTVTAGAQMYYTLTNNGTTPTRQNGTLIASNNGSVVVPGGTIKILKAFAFKSGMTDSDVTSGRYDNTDPGTGPAGAPSGNGTGATTQTLTPPPPRTVSYNVDPLNRHGVTDNGVTTAYTPNLLNQYTQVGSSTLGYDANFNLTDDGNHSYQFDAQNELVGADGVTVKCIHDGLGRVLKRTINGSVTIFVYDGWKVFEELNASGTQKAWNVYGAGPDEILYRSQSSTVLLYHTDKEGNVTYLLDGTGNAIEHYTYDAFGAATITDMQGNPRVVSAYGNDYMFNGKEYVTEMNLYYYCHRWYQPQLGRFLQVDPKGFDAGDENLFRYCSDDPVNRTDPDGMFGMPPEQSITGDQISAADRFDLINLGGETSQQGNLAATALGDYNNQIASGSGNMNSGTNHFVGQIDAMPSGNSQRSSTPSYRYEELGPTKAENKTVLESRYQLINPQNKPAVGGEFANRETQISSKSDGVVETRTSHDYNPVRLSSKGILTDKVSAPIIVGSHVNRHIVQRFTNELVGYSGLHLGNISTVFEHEFVIRNSQVISIETRIVVP